MRKISDMVDANELSGPDWVKLLGCRFRAYRMASRQTQQEVAVKSGVTVQTIRKFEQGKADNITMTNFIALMKTIGMVDNIEAMLPEIPLSPYLIDELTGNKNKESDIKSNEEYGAESAFVGKGSWKFALG